MVEKFAQRLARRLLAEMQNEEAVGVKYEVKYFDWDTGGVQIEIANEVLDSEWAALKWHVSRIQRLNLILVNDPIRLSHRNFIHWYQISQESQPQSDKVNNHNERIESAEIHMPKATQGRRTIVNYPHVGLAYISLSP